MGQLDHDHHEHRQGYEQWDDVYRTYAPESLPWELGRPRPQLVDLFESGKVPVEGRALDLCCGLGTNTVYLANLGFETAAIDIAPTSVAYARKKAELAGVDIAFHIGDSTNLPFAEGSFRFVLDMGCFHHVHIDDRWTYLTGVRRVLAPGGMYFLICFGDRNGGAWNHFSEERLTALLEPHLQLLELREFTSEESDRKFRHFRTVLAQKPQG